MCMCMCMWLGHQACMCTVAVVEAGLGQVLFDHARGGVRNGALLRRVHCDIDGGGEELCEACDDDVGVGDHLQWMHSACTQHSPDFTCD